MFYSQVILARKGPLGKIWIAAHYERRLTKQQIFSTDITQSVETVLNPTQPLALRVSGHLMLGIIRIYSKKVKYLMVDCTEAMWKMKLHHRDAHGKHAIDIDTAHLHAAAIDDIKNYGHLPKDDRIINMAGIDDPEFFNSLMNTTSMINLADMGFASQMLPYDTTPGIGSSRRAGLGHLDDVSVYSDISDLTRGTTGTNVPGPRKTSGPGAGRLSPIAPSPIHDLSFHTMEGRVSELEAMRGATPGSIAGGRSPLSTERRRMSSLSLGGPGSAGGKFDEELPGFGEEPPWAEVMGVPPPLPAGPGFIPLEPPIPEHPMEEEEEEEESKEIEREMNESEGLEMEVEQPKTRRVMIQEEEEWIPSPPVRATTKGVKNHVVIDERVEFQDKTLRMRVMDNSIGLRREVHNFPMLDREQQKWATMPLHLPTSSDYAREGLCDELAELYDMTADRAPLPFPSKKPRPATEYPSQIPPVEIPPPSPPLVEPEEARTAAARRMAADRLSMAGGPIPLGPPTPDMTGVIPEFEVQPPELIFTAATGIEREKGDYPPIEDILLRPGYTNGKLESTAAASIIGDVPMNRRSRDVFAMLNSELVDKGMVTASEFLSGCSKQATARGFIELLQLKQWNLVELQQENPFDDIEIRLVD